MAIRLLIWRRFMEPRQSTHVKDSAFAGPKKIFILFALTSILFSLGGAIFYHFDKKAVIKQKYDELKAIADTKARRISSLKHTIEADARIYATGLIPAEIIQSLAYGKAGQDDLAEIKKRFQIIRTHIKYDNPLLVGTDGRVLVSLDTAYANIKAETKQLAERSLSLRKILFGNPYHSQKYRKTYLDVSVPVFDATDRPAAVLILCVDFEKTFCPIVQSRPMPGLNAEILLVKKDGNRVLFLNRPRHMPGSASSTAAFLSEKADTASASAANGRSGMFFGHDYRGAKVLADLRPVAGFPWFLVTKADSDGILAGFRKQGILVALLTLILILLSGACAGYYYKHREKRAFQTLYRWELDRRNAEEECKTILYSIGDAVITTDRQGRISKMNPVAEDLTGWREAEARDRPLGDVFMILSEETGKPSDNPAKTVLEIGRATKPANNTLLVSRNGRQVPISYSGAPIQGETGDISGVVLVFQDQTQKREMERLLGSRLKLLEYADKHSLDALIQKTIDEVCLLTRSQMGLYQVVDPDVETLFLKAWFFRTRGDSCKLAGTKPHLPLENAGIWADCVRTKHAVVHNDYHGLPGKKGLPEGHPAIKRNLIVPIIRSGRTVALFGVANKPEYYTQKDIDNATYYADLAWDIIERKQNEMEMRRLFSALNQSPVSIITTDINGNIEYVNPKFTEITGYTLEEVMGKNPRILKSGETPQEEYQKLWETILSGKEWRGEFHNRRKDGSLFWERASIAPVLNENGKITNFIGIKEDITREKNLENQLRQAQKMESVGRLAGGVAHDFNNMLMVIIGNTEMALNMVDRKSPVFDDLQEILNAARRSAELTRQLLAFARKQTIRPEVLDINDSISGMLKLLRRVIGENIELDWVPGDDIRPVLIDPAQVDQMLANLLVNARDAITGSGTVTIETANVEFTDDYCADHAGFIPGQYVMIAVTDTGVGMDSHTLKHAFEPFFTTKDQGKGTGLGLSTVYGIVKQNNGFINIYSEQGQGTTVKIYLPCTKKGKPEKVTSMQAEGENLRGSETVLIVEDEKSILDLTRSYLEKYGYNVLSAEDPLSAIKLAAAYDKPIHLLISDVVMPHMSGRELSEKIAAEKPGIKCLFMSGYTANAIAKNGVLDRDANFIQKPFSMVTMAQKVRQVLDEKSRPDTTG